MANCFPNRWLTLLRSILLIAAAIAIATPANSQSRRPRALANVSGADAENAAKQGEPVERITFDAGGRQQIVTGRILAEAADGGLLVQSSDGVLTPVDGPMVITRTPTNTTFRPLTTKNLASKLADELPAGFRIHTTPHYVVCYDTSREYAEWVSSLFERLYKAFTAYWQRQGFALHEPEFPLIVVAYSDRSAYEAASRGELGDAARNIIGYYSLLSNRVNMFDLTGSESLRGANGENQRRGSLREINQMLSQRSAIPLVATIVHEATHQIAFNCGMQRRLSDIPLWQCEGMAMVFEAPDLASSRGWRGIGRVNYSRLETFHRNLPNWQPGSLERMVIDNRMFRDPKTAIAAYADAWALNYYLMKYRADDYADYLKTLAEKPPLHEDDSATRLADFRKHFGSLDELESQFLKQMSRVE